MPDAPIDDSYRSRSQRALERQIRRRARAVVLCIVLGAAGVAIWALPKLQTPLPRDTSSAASRALPMARRDTIRRGERVVAVLIRAGLDRRDADAVLATSEARAIAKRSIPLTLFADSANAPIREVEFQIADDRSIRVIRSGEGTWSATERREIWHRDTVVLRGLIRGTLVESVRLAGRGTMSVRGRLETAYALSDAFEYKLDVGRDLSAGDSVVAIVERRRTAFGAEEVGPLVAGALFHAGEWLRAIRFTTPKGSAEYYDVEGRPMRTTFLAAPLDYRRTSSGFGLRRHPILGTVRRHEGIDFAAPLGSPVRAVGDGAVIKAGYGGGFGRMVEIRHRDGMITRYGHLRGFAQSLREGQVVTLGQVIGYVGSTGLSTGPHLHFETLVNGVSKEPTRTLREASGVTLSGAALSEFAVARAAVASRLGFTVSPSSGAPSPRRSELPATLPVNVAPAAGAGRTK